MTMCLLLTEIHHQIKQIWTKITMKLLAFRHVVNNPNVRYGHEGIDCDFGLEWFLTVLIDITTWAQVEEPNLVYILDEIEIPLLHLRQAVRLLVEHEAIL